MIIYIIDSSKKLENEDREILKLLENKKTIIVLNKQDLKEKISIDTEEIIKTNKPIIKLSALKKEGIEQLYKKISEMFKLGDINIDDSITVTNERHKKIIKEAQKNTNESIASIDNNMPLDIVQISIKQILEELGKITGNSVSEEIINEIF